MSEIRKDLPPLPSRMRGLPIDHRGFPVPWFVWFNEHGQADFRVVGPNKIVAAVKQNLCWLCGQPKGRHHAFVIGPMCAINRTISEPSSHLECAEFAAKGCPFMTQPRMRRNEKDLPVGYVEAPGVGLKRNPGAVCIWVTKEFKLMKVGNGVLFRLGEPEQVLWFSEGRPATREEVEASIDSGLHLLRQPAEEEGPEAVAELDRYIQRVRPLLPPARAAA